MAQIAMLERHIMQAQARSMNEDERKLQHSQQRDSPAFPDLGLPPSSYHFRTCLDSKLLREHNLITPDDYMPDGVAPIHATQGINLVRFVVSHLFVDAGTAQPSYLRQTQSSIIRASEDNLSPVRVELASEDNSLYSNSVSLPNMSAHRPKMTSQSVSVNLWMGFVTVCNVENASRSVLETANVNRPKGSHTTRIGQIKRNCRLLEKSSTFATGC